jgi:indole-3-glycerol phosphate synthase
VTGKVLETGTILDRIVAQTTIDLERRRQAVPPSELHDRAARRPAPIDVRSALVRDHVAVIAEFKRASPSRGRFPVDVDPAEVALDYAAGGAVAISCLTDEPFFQGSLDDLADVAAATSSIDSPIGVLRKDFIVDRYQIDEARAYGASCILLIVACLADDLLRDLQEYAASHGLSVLVEVHDEDELDRALSGGANLVGINNRDLRTFTVDLGVTSRLAPRVPGDIVLVGESGIVTPNHVEQMGEVGVDAVLVGESLILQDDRAAAVRALSGIPKVPRA